MGNYISQSDIEDVFGAVNVAIWSNLEGGSSANTTRIAKAISYAEALIDDSFRKGKYDLPFSPIPALVIDWASKFAGMWLFTARPNFDEESAVTTKGFGEVRKSMFSEMKMYNSGQMTFSSNRSTDNDVNAPQVV